MPVADSFEEQAMIQRTLWSLVLALLAIGSGCQHHNLTCNSCGNGNSNISNTCGPTRNNGRPVHVSHAQNQAMNQGPQAGSYAYPYYTTLGPRDFLMNNPPSIGS